MKKKPIRRPLTPRFRPPLRFPLSGAKQIADALGITCRRLEQLIAEGEAARSETLRYPDSIGYLTRDLLPKDKRARYLPVHRGRCEYIMCSVLSQTQRLAQKRDTRGRLIGEPDFAKDHTHWVGTVHLVATGEPGTFRIDKGRVEDLPNARFGPFEVDVIGDPIIEMTYADLLRWRPSTTPRVSQSDSYGASRIARK